MRFPVVRYPVPLMFPWNPRQRQFRATKLPLPLGVPWTLKRPE